MKKSLLIIFMLLPFFAAAQNHGLPVFADKNVYILQNQRYDVAFSDSYGLPVWSRYNYTSMSNKGPHKVPEEWITDSRIKTNKVTAKEIDAARLCKTQLYPAEHATTNIEAQKASYLSSNIMPMLASIKENIWDRITKEIEEVAEKKGQVEVYSGPVFEKDFSRNSYIISNRVVMPKYFYRIYVYYEGTKPVVVCYRFANHAPSDYERTCELSNFKYDLKKLEEDTGIDFFPAETDSKF